MAYTRNEVVCFYVNCEILVGCCGGQMTEVLFCSYGAQTNGLLCEYDEGQRNKTSSVYGVNQRNDDLFGCGAGSKNGALSVYGVGYQSKVLV